MLPILLALAVPTAAWGLLKAKLDYRIHGCLTAIGLISLCVMLLVPTLMLEYATTYHLPRTPIDFVGVFVGAIGLAFALVGLIAFRSMPKVLCLDAGRLTVSGPYRFSRNPQYVGWFLFLLGFALTDWSLWCLAALLISAIALHLLVLVEEEHLERVFAEPYRAFCRTSPRYVGWRFARAERDRPGTNTFPPPRAP